MGWAFAVHMAVTCVGLVVVALLGAALRRSDTRKDALDVAGVIGINLLVVSPYLVLLLFSHGALTGNPRHQIPPWSPHLLEATARLGFLLPLAAWGTVVAWRRDRLGRAWAAQAIGALLAWLSYYALSALDLAKERDDVFYWVRFLAAILAAVGAWDLARRAVSAAGGRAASWLGAPARLAGAAALATVPLLLPYWWDPARMDLYFGGSLAPLPASITAPAAALRGRPDGIVAGDPQAARWIAALTGRRAVLVTDFPMSADLAARLRLTDLLLQGDPAAPSEAARYRVSHFVVTSAMLQAAGLTLDDLDRRPYLSPVTVGRDPGGAFVAVYEVRS
jgi:hypothetical protein